LPPEERGDILEPMALPVRRDVAHPRSGRLLATVFCWLLLSPALALANGRPPATNGAATGPHPSRLLAQATFGLLLSQDQGQTWQWICEQAVGFTATYDPKVTFTADGALLATTVYGLGRSTDGGCSFVPATGLPDTLKTGELAAHPTDATIVLATLDPMATDQAMLFRSTDGGASFSAVTLPSDTPPLSGLAFSPSAAGRVVLVASSASATRILVSDDAGQTFTVAGEVAQGLLRLVGQSPSTAGRIYLGFDDFTQPAVLYLDVPDQSSGAPLVPTQLTQTPGRVNGFLELSGALVAATETGLLRSMDNGATWTTEAHPRSLCLIPDGEGGGLSCGLNYLDMYALARVTAMPGATALLNFKTNITGPVVCPAGTATHDSCGALWQNLACQLGNDDGCRGGSTPDGGTGGSADGSADLGGGTDQGTGGGGSGCAVAGAISRGPGGQGGGALAALAALLLAVGVASRAARRGPVRVRQTGARAVILVGAAGLFGLAAGCGGGDGNGHDVHMVVDAVNDPGCPAIVNALMTETMNVVHQTCALDRECTVVTVNCCLDPHGQLVVSKDSAAEVTRLAAQYDNLCPVPCQCNADIQGVPGCERGLQLCGYN
jgi:hypothetical protein